MSHTALVRFAPAYDTRHLIDDRAGAPDLMVGSDALKRVRLDESTPVLVDHDPENVVGRVRNAWIFEDVDYGTRLRRWWFADCELTNPPGWLKRGGGVSWSYHPLSTYDVDGVSIITNCIFREVSLLSPATSPAEPLARVCLVKELPAAGATPGPAAGEVIWGDGQVVRRYFPNAVISVR